jgi:hypothetical protein
VDIVPGGRDRGVARPSCRASEASDVGAHLPGDRSSSPGGSATPGLRLVAILPSLENCFNVRGISTPAGARFSLSASPLAGVTVGRRETYSRAQDGEPRGFWQRGRQRRADLLGLWADLPQEGGHVFRAPLTQYRAWYPVAVTNLEDFRHEHPISSLRSLAGPERSFRTGTPRPEDGPEAVRNAPNTTPRAGSRGRMALVFPQWPNPVESHASAGARPLMCGPGERAQAGVPAVQRSQSGLLA